MNATLEPDPEFARHLEWQLRTELRRRARFGGADGPVPAERGRSLGRRLRVLALVLVSLFVGGAGVVAAEHYQGRERRELIETRAALQLVLAQRHEEVAATHLQRIEAGYAAGIRDDRAVVEARTRHARAGHAVERGALDLAEVRASGQAPRNGLSAPLVSGRDYVLLRLDLDRAGAIAKHELAQRMLDRVQQLTEVGRIGAGELQQKETEVGDAASELELLEQLLVLRTRYLHGELTARDVDLRGARVRAESGRSLAARGLSAAQAALERLEAMASVGRIGRHEVEAARLRVEELESAVLLADLELKVLAGELGR